VNDFWIRSSFDDLDRVLVLAAAVVVLRVALLPRDGSSREGMVQAPVMVAESKLSFLRRRFFFGCTRTVVSEMNFVRMDGGFAKNPTCDMLLVVLVVVVVVVAS
jgi:hypothetical protein